MELVVGLVLVVALVAVAMGLLVGFRYGWQAGYGDGWVARSELWPRGPAWGDRGGDWAVFDSEAA